MALAQRFGIADLHRHFLRRPMQNRLAVKADDIDLLAGDMILRREARDRLGVGHGHDALGLAAGCPAGHRAAAAPSPR